MLTTNHFTSTRFEAHLDALAEIPRWFKRLDDHLTHRVFNDTVLGDRLGDAIVTRTLHIVGGPTPAKMRGLALAVCTHWMRMQSRCKDPYAHAHVVVTFVERIADRLGGRDARKDFVDALNDVCVEKLTRTWRWYVSLVSRGVSPDSRDNLFMRVMTVVAMTGCLFRRGLLRCDAVLDGVEHIATMSLWLDALAIVYALLHELGPGFTQGQAGWHFVRRLLFELSPLTTHRVHSDPLHHLVSAINALVTESHRGTSQVALYHS